MLKLARGLHKFQTEIHSINEDFFQHLAKGQSPQVLFICCSDSRINPNLITQTDPGELFTLRNAGNIVPPFDVVGGGEEATIEYAIMALGVKDIVVCGHSNCGALNGLLHPQHLETMPAVRKWLEFAKDTLNLVEKNYGKLDEAGLLNIAIQENVLMQLEHLRTLPAVQRGLWKREVEIHGWVYEIETGEVYVYDPIYEQFLAIHYVEGEWHLETPHNPDDSDQAAVGRFGANERESS
jgi:carbonic anhydrase